MNERLQGLVFVFGVFYDLINNWYYTQALELRHPNSPPNMLPIPLDSSLSSSVGVVVFASERIVYCSSMRSRSNVDRCNSCCCAFKSSLRTECSASSSKHRSYPIRGTPVASCTAKSGQFASRENRAMTKQNDYWRIAHREDSCDSDTADDNMSYHCIPRSLQISNWAFHIVEFLGAQLAAPFVSTIHLFNGWRAIWGREVDCKHWQEARQNKQQRNNSEWMTEWAT